MGADLRERPLTTSEEGEGRGLRMEPHSSRGFGVRDPRRSQPGSCEGAASQAGGRDSVA